MKKKTFVNIIAFFICLIPTTLMIGAAVSELCVIIISSLFLIYTIIYKDWYYYKSTIFIILCLFSLYCITVSLFSEFPQNSLSSTLFYFRFFLMLLSIWFVMDNQKFFPRFFLLSIMIPIFMGFLYSFYQVFDPSLQKMRLSDFRISGFFGEELVQGSYSLRLLVLFTGIYLLIDKEFKNKFLYLFFLFIFIFLILISGERASIGLMFVFLTLFFIFINIKLVYKMFTLTTISALIFLSLIYLPGLKERIYDNTKNLLNENNEIKIFSRGHQEHYISAIKMFKKNIFTGVGVRNFRLECRKDEYKSIGLNACTTHPHNTYMQFLAETGLIGVFFILSLLVYISYFLLRSFFNLLKSKTINRAKVFFSVSVFINIFPFVPTGNFFNNWLSVMYFLPLAFFFYKVRNID